MNDVFVSNQESTCAGKSERAGFSLLTRIHPAHWREIGPIAIGLEGG